MEGFTVARSAHCEGITEDIIWLLKLYDTTAQQQSHGERHGRLTDAPVANIDTGTGTGTGTRGMESGEAGEVNETDTETGTRNSEDTDTGTGTGATPMEGENNG